MSRPPRPCMEPGCGTLTRYDRCPRHARAHRAGKPRRGGSGGAWETKRRHVFHREHGRCQRCGVMTALRERDVTPDRPLAIAHHTQRFSEGGSEHTDDLELLCSSCHHQEHEPPDARKGDR